MAELTERLSIVMPVYNEVKAIEAVLAELDRAILAHLPTAELVVIDDASTDGTGALLDGLADRYDRLRVVHATVNVGHGPTVSRAIGVTNGDWILQLDSDLECDVNDFWLLWSHRSTAELVLGVREPRRAALHRLLLSRLAAAVVSLLAGRRIADANTPFRLFRRALWDELQPYFPRSASVPSLLTSLGAGVQGRPIVEIPVTHRARPFGRSSLSAAGLLIFSARALAELLICRARLASTLPRSD